jgi:hypothetical protein
VARTGGGHHTPGTSGGAVRDDSPVDKVWRRRLVKLDPEEGEAPGNEREAGAHRSGPASGAARQDPTAASSRRWPTVMWRGPYSCWKRSRG